MLQCIIFVYDSILHTRCGVIMAQLFFAGLIAILLDELLQKGPRPTNKSTTNIT